MIVNDTLGCNSVSWAPYTAIGNTYTAENGELKSTLRLVTGSCDNTVRIWRYDGNWEARSGKWVEEKKERQPHHGMCHCEQILL